MYRKLVCGFTSLQRQAEERRAGGAEIKVELSLRYGQEGVCTVRKRSGVAQGVMLN